LRKAQHYQHTQKGNLGLHDDADDDDDDDDDGKENTLRITPSCSTSAARSIVHDIRYYLPTAMMPEAAFDVPLWGMERNDGRMESHNHAKSSIFWNAFHMYRVTHSLCPDNSFPVRSPPDSRPSSFLDGVRLLPIIIHERRRTSSKAHIMKKTNLKHFALKNQKD